MQTKYEKLTIEWKWFLLSGDLVGWIKKLEGGMVLIMKLGGCPITKPRFILVLIILKYKFNLLLNITVTAPGNCWQLLLNSLFLVLQDSTSLCHQVLATDVLLE